MNNALYLKTKKQFEKHRLYTECEFKKKKEKLCFNNILPL